MVMRGAWGVLALLMAAGLAQAQTPSKPVELLRNGNFETGNLNGWTLNSDNLNRFYAIPNGGAGVDSGAPTQFLAGGGSFVAVADQNGVGASELRQAFSVSARTSSLVLAFDWFNNTHAAQAGTDLASSRSQVGRIDILRAGAPAFESTTTVVRNLILNAGTLTDRGTAIPWAHATFDLSGLAPGNYEIRFGNRQFDYFQEMGVDNVSLLAQAAPIPEPATALSMLLGLGAVLMSRRARVPAA